VNLTYNNIWGNSNNYAGFTPGVGSTSECPGFVDPDNQNYDLYASTAYWTSPCVGTGTPEGTGVNMGYYQGAGEAGSPYLYESYVSGEGSDSTGDGTSEATAWRSITYAKNRTLDTIDVGAGMYTSGSGESFPIYMLDMQISGAGTAASTIENDVNSTDLVRLGPNSSFEGFTLKSHAQAMDMIEVQGSNVTIQSSQFLMNDAYGYGIRCNYTGLLVKDNIIKGQNSTNSYAGIYMTADADNFTISGNVIRNWASGIEIQTDGGTNLIERNTIVKNLTYGIHFDNVDTCTVNVRNNIVAYRVFPGQNWAYTGIYAYSVGATVNLTYNNVWGHATNYSGFTPGVGSISEFPGFAGAGVDNYDLFASTAYWTNPCLGTGTPEGTGVNMGAYQGTGEAGSHFLYESYINPAGDNTTGDGTSEATAWRTISAAKYRTIDTINVGPGTYTAASGESFPIAICDQHVKGVGRDLATVECGTNVDMFSLYVNSTLEGLTIDGNANAEMVYVYGGNVTIKDNNLEAPGQYWAVYSNVSGTRVEGNNIWGDSTDGGIIFYNSAANYYATHNLIRDFDYGIQIEPDSGSNTVEHNTIVKNDHTGIYLYNADGGTHTIQNNIVANGVGGHGVGTYGIYNNGSSGTIDLSYNDVYASGTNWSGVSSGEGSISVDPIFEDAASNVFTLLGTSPCIDAGTPEGEDLGAFPFDLPVLLITLLDPDGGETWAYPGQRYISWETI
ncbi:right-handed parallel beta-helix repeat-containing protein, partial [Candidatus Margulisiibacteriota bacterium]